MRTVVIDRRLETCTGRELNALWEQLAPILAAKEDPRSGRLPPYWQRLYDDLRGEFARRGVQLQLFE